MKESAFIQVKTASIPYSWYNINDYNNIFDINLDGTGYSFTIPPGNYNVNTLIEEIQLLLTAAGIPLSMEYTIKTNHIEFSHATLPFSFLSSSTISEVIGFQEGVSYTASQLGDSSYFLESVNGFNLFTVRQILISSDNFQLDNISSYSPQNKSNLASLLVIGNPNSIIHFSQTTSPHEIHNVNNLTNLHLKLTDELGRALLLNNMNWSITLTLTFKQHEGRRPQLKDV